MKKLLVAVWLYLGQKPFQFFHFHILYFLFHKEIFHFTSDF